MLRHATKQLNRFLAVALSAAMLSTATVGIVPLVKADDTVPDASSWQYTMVEDFESLAVGTSYANWGKYPKNVADEAKSGVGAGNSIGLYVHTTGDKDSAYGQPFYYMNKEADYTGAEELWIWYDNTAYQDPNDLIIRPRMMVGATQEDPTMISDAPIYFQTSDGWKASTLTTAPDDTPTAECAIRKEDLTGFKGYIRIPLTDFRDSNGDPFSGTITNFVGGYWIFDFSFITDDNENYVENGFVMDNVLLAGPTMTNGLAVSELLGSGDSKDAAQKVIDQIDALPAVDALTAADKDAVAAARAAYDALPIDAQAQVTNYSTLTADELKMVELCLTDTEKAAVDDANAKITALPAADSLTLADKDAVTAARTAYDAVPAAAQVLIKDYTKLTNDEAKIAELEDTAAKDQQAADAVTKMIGALPATILPTDADTVKAARDAYDKLNDAQKALVTNVSILEAAEKTIASYNNRLPEDPDPSWSYLSLADFDNLQTGYKFGDASEVDTTSQYKNVYKYMNEPNGKQNHDFYSVVEANGFNGSNALNVCGVAGDTDGSYAQPLIRCDKLNNDTYKDYTGAQEFVMYVDFTNVKMDTVGLQFRLMENDMDASGQPTGTVSQWGLKEGGYVYIQVNGVWTKVSNSDSNYEETLGILPVEVSGRQEIPAGSNSSYPDGLAEVQGYKGMVRIPLSQLALVGDSADVDGKMDLTQVCQLWMVFNWPGKQDTSSFAMDEFGFVGNFATTGQGETNVLSVLPLSQTTTPTDTGTTGTTATKGTDTSTTNATDNGTSDTTTASSTSPATGDTGAMAGAACGLLAVIALSVCLKSRKHKI